MAVYNRRAAQNLASLPQIWRSSCITIGGSRWRLKTRADLAATKGQEPEGRGIQKGGIPLKVLLSVLAIFLIPWPVPSAEQNRAAQNGSSDADAAKRERQIYQDRAESKLRELDRQIDDLKTKVLRENKSERQQLDQQISELERKRDVVQQKLEKLKASSQEAWRDMRSGIDAAMDDLEAAYKRAAARFK